MPRLLAAIRLRACWPRLALALSWSALVFVNFAGRARAVAIEFDYTYDASGFFGTALNPSPARTTLEFAARSFTPFFDELAAIEPGGGNSWVARFTNPSTGFDVEIPNLAVQANTINVFVGARDLGVLGLSEFGRAQSLLGATSFRDAVANRGEGDPRLDSAPWGGSIAFDTYASATVPRSWHYNLDSPPPAGAFDFYSAAVHELAHVLGFGSSSAYSAALGGEHFHGATAVDLYGGPVRVTLNTHWHSTVMSPPFELRQAPAMGRDLFSGQRKLFAPIDYAAMADIGWSVPPELLRLPGDADGDGRVDGSDFLDWQENLGGFGGSVGDVDGSLLVDGFDGWIIRQTYGKSAAPSASSVLRGAAVPEPAAATLAVFATICLEAVSKLRFMNRTLSHAG
jgi:hypothetical protein